MTEPTTTVARIFPSDGVRFCDLAALAFWLAALDRLLPPPESARPAQSAAFATLSRYPHPRGQGVSIAPCRTQYARTQAKEMYEPPKGGSSGPPGREEPRQA